LVSGGLLVCCETMTTCLLSMARMVAFGMLALALTAGMGRRCLAEGGACCSTGCSCTVVASPAACPAPSTFFVFGSCAPLPCTGSCCNASFCFCTTNATVGTCTSPNIFTCGGTCVPSPCFGKCCNAINGQCTVTAAVGCAAPHVFTCFAVCTTPCPGVCCDNATSTCNGHPISGCAPGTLFQGLASTCTPTTCASTTSGVCCSLSGTCMIAAPSQCPLTWWPASCTATTCVNSPVGACCAGAVCLVTFQYECTTGVWGGAATACNSTGGTPCCRADFNKVAGVTIQDIFDYLNAWFAGDSRTDFDGVGGVAIADIFGFLSAWFMGC
jgi:hypothetical protein